MPAIAVSQLSKSFQRGHRALADIAMTVGEGEMVALIGASGSGKSTLLRHLSGLTIADRNGGAARVEILGRPMQAAGRLARDARRIRADVGMVFQQFNLVGRLSVLTNVLLGCLGRIPGWRGTLGMFTEDEKRDAMRALARVGMADYAAQRASTLSGGQQQRVAIARTLMQKARVILADEPIASLDPASANTVMEALATINREDGITVVVSLHQVNYAAKYCPRTVAMRGGQVVYDGVSTALTPAFLTDLYGADSEELLIDARPERDLEVADSLARPAFAAGM
ncbi:phosphonate ABC transporter ATP-binding protein [Caenispirillum bisanense]|uniref:Phosphonate transport system ATP-binding protein n=1 Tax=Caenispirillum bisanense TaxID=414052 RepID=A0A286GZJ1_9PROT|nr:phosphonate ABC transporter ATP-binding protein [Caenispirillum bisanense]SOE00958.1 phosphonate transport system ATP-binding protein [Caenispirillum bisanense]